MSKTGNCNYFSTIFKKLERREEIRIVGLGDSLTYGWEASFSYFDLFISKLRANYCGVTIQGHNAGICGDTAAGGERRVVALLAPPTDAVIVQFGINDLYSEVPIAGYKASMGAICRKIIRAGAIPLPITSGPLLYSDQQKKIAPYYRAIKEITEAYECPFADVAERWHKRHANLKDLYFEDGVHPNDSGYHAMADALYEICYEL